MKSYKIRKLIKILLQEEKNKSLLLKKINGLKREKKMNEQLIKMMFHLYDEGEIKFSDYAKKCLYEFVNSKL